MAEQVKLTGLTEQEAVERRSRGQGNNVRPKTGRTYGDILIQNTFTFMNVIFFLIGAVMIVLGLWSDAIITVGVVAMNVVIGISQEMRAKRQLDKIALLTRPTVSSLIVGGRNEAQFRDSLAAVSLQLTAEDLAKLNEVSKPPLIYPYWHQGQFARARFSPADWVLHEGNEPPAW